MFKGKILAVLVAGAAGLSAVGMARADVTAASGVNIHFTDPRPGEMEMLGAAGFRHIRMDFTWQSTEKQKGVYDFSAYERLTAALEKHGMKPYYILDYANTHYEQGRSVRTEEGRKAYTKWALAAVEHFKGRGVHWEIWNEPNGGFWAPVANVKEYAAMAVMASKAIKEAHPQEYLSGPATSTIDLAFLESCFQEGLLQWWDAVTVHPYRQTGPEMVEPEYHALRGIISRYAPKGKKVDILSGEWGYSSSWMNHDDDTQARSLSRQWLVNAANGIPISIWYDWHDDGQDAKEAEHNFGTVEYTYHAGRDPVYDPKPSYHAAKTFNSTLKGFNYVKRLSLGSSDHYALLFENSGKHVLAVWTTASGQRDAHLPSSDGTFKVIGHLGNDLPSLVAKDGKLEFKISGDPSYILLDGANPKLAAAPEALNVKVAIVPVTGKELIVKVDNLSDHEVKALVIPDRVSGLELGQASQQVTIPADSTGTDVIFPLKALPSGGYDAGAKIEVDGVVLSEIPPRRFSPPDDAVLKDAHVSGEGDKNIGGSFTLSQAQAPAQFPGGSGAVMQLDYEFVPGWKYAPVYPKQAGRPLEGRPGETHGRALFGIWIYGDSSQLAPRLRVKDADGKVWQPAATQIKWTGWKYVEMKLDETTAHWGGKEDQQKRGPKFPLKWDAPFLLDNPHRTAHKGTIWFSMPVIILE